MACCRIIHMKRHATFSVDGAVKSLVPSLFGLESPLIVSLCRIYGCHISPVVCLFFLPDPASSVSLLFFCVF